MRFESVHDFALLLDVDHLDLTLISSYCNEFSSFVEAARSCRWIPNIYCQNLRYLTDVPYLEKTVSVAGCDELAPNTESAVVNWVHVAVEGLNAETSSHIPNTKRFVCATANEEVSERLPHQSINTVSMTAELLPHLYCMQVKQLYSAICTACKNEVPGVVELGFPERTSRNISECVSDSRSYKVPKF